MPQAFSLLHPATFLFAVLIDVLLFQLDWQHQMPQAFSLLRPATFQFVFSSNVLLFRFAFPSRSCTAQQFPLRSCSFLIFVDRVKIAWIFVPVQVANVLQQEQRLLLYHLHRPCVRSLIQQGQKHLSRCKKPHSVCRSS